VALLRLSHEIARPPHDVFAVVVNGAEFATMEPDDPGVEGGRTRVDHELEMTPRGWYRLLGPMMTMTGRINLKATADALRQHLEG
jgi:hypothetical protein